VYADHRIPESQAIPLTTHQILIPYFLLSYLYNIFLHPLRAFPGPKTWAASELPFVTGLLNGTCTARIIAFHKEYSDVIRTGPDRLSFINADAFKDIYGHRQGRPNMGKDMKFYGKPPREAWNLLMQMTRIIRG
jgi:hypothetical protein